MTPSAIHAIAAPIQSLWIGPLGLLERLSMASFVANGHPYHLYAYDEIVDLPQGVEWRDAAAILPRDRIFVYPFGRARGGLGGFANLFRYKLLAERGGWWCDTDVIALRPFDFTDEIVIASERHWLWRRRLCNNVIRCPAGHTLMVACHEEAAAMDPTRLAFAANGAPILRRQIARLGLHRFVKPPEVFNPVNWYQSEDVAALAGARCTTDSTYAVHCYRETWRWRLRGAESQGFRDRVFDADTLLGQLQRRYLPPDSLTAGG